jgi:hypothetical protein
VKFLKSQGIVLILAAFAILLVGKNLVWPFLKPKFASRAQPAAAVAADAKPTVGQKVVQTLANRVTEVLKTVQTQTPVAQVAILERIDAQALQANAPNWVASPLRDPFKMRGGVSDKPARDQLTLTGILRQTDSELAVINNLILSAGEMILGFRVETVEADRVWVSGPNGREALEFKHFVQAPAKPAHEVSPVAPSAAAMPAPEESSPPIAPATAPVVAITAPLVREPEKGREPSRQGIGIADGFTSGPPIDR